MTRRGLLAVGAAAGMIVAAAPALAQDAASDSARLKLMLECDAIHNESTRLACYDGAARRSRSSMGANRPGMLPGLKASQPMTPAQSFGMNGQLARQRQDMPAKPEGPSEISARVASAADNGVGMWQVNFIDGARWKMTEGSRDFKPPRAGDTVRIRKATMGSYLMYVGAQPSVRVVRIH